MSNPKPSSTVADGQDDTFNDLIKLLTKQDGTLCDFCHDALTNPPESGAPFLTRALSKLVDASSYCGFCAMWMRALEQSAQDLGEAGQDVARELHPLVQDSVEPEDVQLQFVSLHDWERCSIEQRIAWPHMGPIWATLDLVKTDDAQYINTGLLAESDHDDLVWKTIRAWLAHCGSNHKFCKWKKYTSWKPSRLIHINPNSEPLEIHLVEGADVPDRVEYLTLSHCWGGGSPLQLTRETLEPFKSLISTDDLPRTFLDACNVVKLLGHKYLWIDSLCIIQDDPEDWAIEAGRMASVYGNAWLSICATAASDVHDGLFSVEEKRDRKAWLPIWVRRAWGGPFSGDYCVSDFRSWWTRLANTLLNRRAWAFQERALAPRVLHLGLEQVAFECCSMCACERLPLGDPIRRQGPYSHNLSDVKDLILGVRNDDLEDLSVADILSHWNQVIRSYSPGRLSYDSDKLVALAGIVECFEKAFQATVDAEAGDGDTPISGQDQKDDAKFEEIQTKLHEKLKISPEPLFLAGLWRPGIEGQLAWRATSRVQHHQLSGNAPPAAGKRSDKYVAPTWSWCSIKDALVEPQQYVPLDDSFIRVLEAKVSPHPDFHPDGAANGLKYCCAPGSYIRLQCSFLPIMGFGLVEGMKFPDLSKEERSMISVDSKNYWDVNFEQEATRCKEPCAVPVFVDTTRVVNPVHCLILDCREDKEGNRYFVRLGAMVLDEPKDVKAFWGAVDVFDEKYPGKGEKFDQILRLVPTAGKTEYEKKDGVLQRTLEIR